MLNKRPIKFKPTGKERIKIVIRLINCLIKTPDLDIFCSKFRNHIGKKFVQKFARICKIHVEKYASEGIKKELNSIVAKAFEKKALYSSESEILVKSNASK